MFEIFEHTADLGIRVEADSLESLFSEAAAGLTSVLVANPEAIEPISPIELFLPGDRPEELLLDWLAELLYRFSVDRMVFRRFEVTRQTDGVAAKA